MCRSKCAFNAISRYFCEIIYLVPFYLELTITTKVGFSWDLSQDMSSSCFLPTFEFLNLDSAKKRLLKWLHLHCSDFSWKSATFVFAENEYAILLSYIRVCENLVWNIHNPAFFGFIGIKPFFHNFDEKTPQKIKVYCSLEPYFHNLLA